MCVVLFYFIFCLFVLKQATDGLMLASIEARIRRLSKLAHSSARQLSCLQRSLQDVPGVIVHSIPPTSPLGSQRGADQRLPEWRFNKVYTQTGRDLGAGNVLTCLPHFFIVSLSHTHFSLLCHCKLKEGDSIFRSMRTVEKWLKGIVLPSSNILQLSC